MSLRNWVVSGCVAVSILIGGVSTSSFVEVDGVRAHVERADTDGLDGIATSSLDFGPTKAFAGCASWDIKENCCPAGCAAKNGSQWSKADNILRGCMRGLGCSESEAKDATVFMKCDCPNK